MGRAQACLWPRHPGAEQHAHINVEQHIARKMAYSHCAYNELGRQCFAAAAVIANARTAQ